MVRLKIAAERTMLNKARIVICNLTDEERRCHPINLSVDQWELEANGEV